jgi:parallel beta-helix repeat protein
MIFALLALLTANPTTLVAKIAKAQPGDTITLEPADYGTVTITRRFTKPLVIKAAGSKLKLVFRNARGIELRGGLVTGAKGQGKAGYGISIDHSSFIKITGVTFADDRRAIVINVSSDVEVADVELTGMLVDGIDIAESQRITVRDSECRDFNSAPPVHPDCVQMWSKPGGITSDVVIENNKALGRGMQGFTGFNHVRDGVDDGGFDRITIVGNQVQGDFPQGIALYSCRQCRVANNTTSRLAGARHKVSINIVNSPDAVVSGNDVGP